MYAVVRSYVGQGVSELFEALAQRQDEIQDLFIREVQGFVSYAAVQTGPDSGTTITVCQDEGGAEESSRVAANWVTENLSTAGVNPPSVAGGTAVAYFTA